MADDEVAAAAPPPKKVLFMLTCRRMGNDGLVAVTGLDSSDAKTMTLQAFPCLGGTQVNQQLVFSAARHQVRPSRRPTAQAITVR